MNLEAITLLYVRCETERKDGSEVGMVALRMKFSVDSRHDSFQSYAALVGDEVQTFPSIFGIACLRFRSIFTRCTHGAKLALVHNHYQESPVDPGLFHTSVVFMEIFQ